MCPMTCVPHAVRGFPVCDGGPAIVARRLGHCAPCYFWKPPVSACLLPLCQPLFHFEPPSHTLSTSFPVLRQSSMHRTHGPAGSVHPLIAFHPRMHVAPLMKRQESLLWECGDTVNRLSSPPDGLCCCTLEQGSSESHIASVVHKMMHQFLILVTMEQEYSKAYCGFYLLVSLCMYCVQCRV